MKKNELKEGEEYAVRTGQGRWQQHHRAVYYGDSPWLTGSGQAILTTIRSNDPNISGGEDGILRYRPKGLNATIKIRNDASLIGFAGKEYLVQPDTSGWRSSAFESPGKGTRGLFVVSGADGHVSFILVAYGDKIMRTWAEEEEWLRAVKARKQQAVEQHEREREALARYRLAIVREALEVLDDLGEDQSLILGHHYTREEVAAWMDADVPKPWLLRQSPNAALILLGAGKHDPFDLLLTYERKAS